MRMKTRFGVLFVPAFRLQAALRGGEARPSSPHPACGPPATAAGVITHKPKTRHKKHPAALLSGRPPAILECNAEALARGVVPGSSLPAATACCPELHSVTRSGEAESTARALLREAALTLSPWVEETARGTCTWQENSSGEPGCGHRALKHGVLPHLAALGREAGAGLGPNPGSALLAARAAALLPERILEVQTPDDLADLPLEHLTAFEPELASVLELWGLRRIGDLAALHRGECVERLGPGAGKLWDCARGQSTRPLNCIHPPESLVETMDDLHMETLEPLLLTLRRMVEGLAARLENLWMAAAEMELRLLMENAPPHLHRFRLPVPSAQANLLMRLLETHLEGLRTTSPVTGVCLEAFPGRAPGRQPGLFEQTLRDPERFLDTLARLEALVGRDRVGVPIPEPTHRPGSFRIIPPDLETPHCAAPPSVRGPGLRRFRPPLSAGVEAAPEPLRIRSAAASGRIAACRGPWCLSGDWWTGQGWKRQEWDIQLEDGLLCRICEENGVWVLEGIYD